MTIDMEIQPLDAVLGARVTGLDLAQALDTATFARIQAAFDTYHVLSFPDQDLSASALVGFSQRFGELEPHLLTEFHHPEHPAVLMLSTVVEEGKPLGFATPPDPMFHSDLSYRPRPTLATILHALEVPADGGGDTRFADTTEAYDALSDEMKVRLVGLRAVHNYAYRYGERLTPEQLAKTEDVVHPVVRMHARSGRKSLFINPSFTGRIEGMAEGESRALLDELFAHCLQPRFTMDYAWAKGDLVMWDNAATMHSATALPVGARRTLMRTTVVGEVPVGP
jgi:taurine dioxygenase